MTPFQTLILRHRKENRRKCSLTPLENDPGFLFLTYPKDPLIDLSSYVLLSLEGEPLSENDSDKGICLIDATWRLASKMQKWLLSQQTLPLRTLPYGAMSAYPRKQTACQDPLRGLASIEALFLAHKILKKETKSLLDHYFWREDFLQKNELFLKTLQ
jgi:pre-rRNA-processing protein TSR3